MYFLVFKLIFKQIFCYGYRFLERVVYSKGVLVVVGEGGGSRGIRFQFLVGVRGRQVCSKGNWGIGREFGDRVRRLEYLVLGRGLRVRMEFKVKVSRSEFSGGFLEVMLREEVFLEIRSVSQRKEGDFTGFIFFDSVRIFYLFCVCFCVFFRLGEVSMCEEVGLRETVGVLVSQFCRVQLLRKEYLVEFLYYKVIVVVD